MIGYLSYQLLQEQSAWFLLAEAAIIISLILAWQLYRSFIRPLQFMYSGTDAIVDKDFNIKFVKTGSKEMDRLIEVYNQMIDNIREERIQVEEQHFFLMKLINASPNGIIILDFDDKIADINPRAEQILELDEHYLNEPLTKFDHPVLKQISALKIGDSKVISAEGNDKYKCQVSQFIHRGFKRKFILIQELSKEILEAEKRAYGKIIRMMAHEVNNSIGAINSILQSQIEFTKAEDPDGAEALQIAYDRNDRMNLFMRNFAKVVRLPKPKFEKTELNIIVANVGKLMYNQAAEKGIKVHSQFSEKSIFVQTDQKQLEQVLVNILKNAVESIESIELKKDAGRIEILTTSEPKTIIIRDNGAGIEPEIADKLFTPFFSTKPEGQGVGLMLIREILTNHEAQFSLKTLEDGWTEFRIVFK